MPTINGYTNVYIEDYEYNFEEEYEISDIYDMCSSQEREEFVELYRNDGGQVPNDDENFTELENLIDKLIQFEPDEFANLPDEVFDELNKRFGTNFVKPKQTFNPALNDEIKLMEQLYQSHPTPELHKELNNLYRLRKETNHE